jgi:hypothetical protein
MGNGLSVHGHHVRFDISWPAGLETHIGWRFVIDVSTSMGKMRDVTIPGEGGKAPRTVQMTNLEWALQFILLKVQELVSVFLRALR